MHPKLLESTVRQCREYIEAGDCHGAPPHVERLIDAVAQLADGMRAADAKLTRIQVGGCTCDTKTPELKHHSERCHFRLASEASALLSVAHGVDLPHGGGDA